MISRRDFVTKEAFNVIGNDRRNQMPNIAVYAGSFDPPTTGHIWMIHQGAMLVDKLIVAVGVHPEKHSSFTIEQRTAWLREIVEAISAELREAGRSAAKIEVDSFSDQFLVQYAASVGASFILRGIRNETDYTYERTMRHINADLQKHITTVFLMPPRELCEVSSSAIKGMIGPRGWEDVVHSYVPESVFRALKEKYAKNRQ